MTDISKIRRFVSAPPSTMLRILTILLLATQIFAITPNSLHVGLHASWPATRSASEALSWIVQVRFLSSPFLSILILIICLTSVPFSLLSTIDLPLDNFKSSSITLSQRLRQQTSRSTRQARLIRGGRESNHS